LILILSKIHIPDLLKKLGISTLGLYNLGA